MAQTIVQKENPVLREKTKEVPLSEITSSQFRNIIKRMKEALDSQDDGVAIAAPQIGEPWRIFVVSGKVFDILKRKEGGGEEGSDGNDAKTKKHRDAAFINPHIIKLSRDKAWVDEGCLSVRYLYGKTHRSKKAVVRAYDENGKLFERGGSGLLAQIFQHETDHLNGILFIDKAKDLKEMPPEKS